MYCLLNYLNPRIFDNKEVFDDCFSLDAQNIVVDRKTLADAHYMLRAFILRRLKTEVEVTLPSKLETLLRCPMSEMQKFWTLQLLSNDAKLLDRINGNESGERATHTRQGQLRLSIEDFVACAPAFPDIDVALLCTTLLVAQSLYEWRAA